MRAKELIKLLKQNGWQEISQKRFSSQNEKTEIKLKLFQYIIKIFQSEQLKQYLKGQG